MCRTQGLELQSSEDSLAEDTEGGLCVCTKWYLILSNDNANVKPGQANTVHEILMILLPHLFSSWFSYILMQSTVHKTYTYSSGK